MHGDGCNHYTGSNSDKNPKAGDLVAVYIQFKNETQCPLQVQSISKNNRYKFYEGSSFNETTYYLNKSPQLSDVNGTVEFNIRYKV